MILFGFKINKSSGVDGISVTYLCDNFKFLEEVLLALINEMILSGWVPEDMKTAIVKPGYKRGPRNQLSSYRPNSLLPCSSQIFKEHILIFLSSFLGKHSIISPS